MGESQAVRKRRPKLLVFDLDYTLWPFWVDTHVVPPFRKASDGNVYDYHNKKVNYYPETPDILEKLHKQGYQIGVASRTSCVEEAKELLRLFDWNKFITYREIYPGSKVAHFHKFKKASGLQFKDMIFFDDEHRNIKDVSKLGVSSIFVEKGISWKVVNEGLEFFSKGKN